MASRSESTSLSVVDNRAGVEVTAKRSPTSVRSSKTKPLDDDRQSSIDFVGHSHAVKDLFSLPYIQDEAINVAVHNMNGTLLIDRVEEDDLESEPPARSLPFMQIAEKRTKKPPENDQNATENSIITLDSLENKSSEALALVNSFVSHRRNYKRTFAERAIKGVPSPVEYTRPYLGSEKEGDASVPNEYLDWRFRNVNMLVGSPTLVYRSDEQEQAALALRLQDAKEFQSLVHQHKLNKESGAFISDEEIARLAEAQKPTYAQTVVTDGAHPESLKPTTLAPEIPLLPLPDPNQLQLHSCEIPATRTSLGTDPSSSLDRPLSAPVSTVLDCYLDNIMNNIPQLALCLQEKGLIQSVKLVSTQDIPSGLLQPSTADTSTPFSVVDETDDPVFSPRIMEMNASALLSFLQTNCTKDSSTYLLRRPAGSTHIQLYDVSAAAKSQQRQWIWRLAMMSYRFAQRLAHVSSTASNTTAAMRRSFRTRQRSLLETTLELLENHSDLDGEKHETLMAAMREQLADTFLQGDSSSVHVDKVKSASRSQRQPFAQASVDALSKAQYHIEAAIRILPAIDPTKDSLSFIIAPEVGSGASASRLDPIHREAIATQLFGLYHKAVDVNLRLAEIHLQNYYSSSAMHSIRLAARGLATALRITRYLSKGGEDEKEWLLHLRSKYILLWEYCGNFSRSFASDPLWRDRGHASGDDVICVLRDAQAALGNGHMNFLCVDVGLIESRTKGSVNLNELSGLVCDEKDNDSPGVSCLPFSSLEVARNHLEGKGILSRDQRRVLVAATISYSRAIAATEAQAKCDDINVSDLQLLEQKLGDACNESGKLMLHELRTILTPSESMNESQTLSIAVPLLYSAEFWFLSGVTVFTNCGDVRNLALLRCNICQCYKLRANNMFAVPSKPASGSQDNASHAEWCLEKAARHLEMAHESIGQREKETGAWDMVSKELAATFLVLGVRRRQSLLGSGTIPVISQALRLSPGKERSIVEPMEKSLAIYDKIDPHQAAATNYQLALFFSKVWTCQRDEAKTKDKLAAAFRHFSGAHAYFSRNIAGNETTFCLLCMDLAALYASVSGEECLVKAVTRCLDGCDTFSPSIIREILKTLATRGPWMKSMGTISASLDERVFQYLRALVKVNKDKYSPIYKAGLTAKVTSSRNENVEGDLATGEESVDECIRELLSVHTVLSSLRKDWVP